METFTKDWSCALEDDEYEKNKDKLILDAIEAVQKTAANHHVNIVTHHVHGHPDNYLVPILQEKFGNSITMKFVDQCSCGGYVLKVTKI